MINVLATSLSEENEFFELSADVSADILLVNSDKTLQISSFYGVSEILGLFREISAEMNNTVFVFSRLEVEGELCNSCIVIEKGRFRGVADSITDEACLKGKSQKVLSNERFSVGICIGRDFLYPASFATRCVGADFTLHATHEEFNCDYFAAVRGRNCFCKEKYISLYKDAIVVNDGGFRTETYDKAFLFDEKNIRVKPYKGFLKFNLIE